ncbi:hypothetical protein RJ639_047444 [Escallonia herrerae]|uniref:Auxin response factor n=1 Tax=Escallonia herrerae TaxID=1293975 RepID=A0AA89B0H8_9ASTE|nr:hypothetical protein RJ639_047444 [Escallonia herrerae]
MAELGAVDPSIWRACAGTCVKIPTVDSRVYYFPQGHAEQSSSPPTFSPLAQSRPSILCRVLSVRFLADPDTDEAFAKIQLLPIDPSRDPRVTEPKGADGNGDGDGDDQVVSFAKILTPSDANNGGGFSVPRFCADSIFPPLNFAADPPVQNIFITDVHGAVWEFRHIYRGTPRRHLLTTGWSKFVNGKKLVAGDSVVFMRNSRNRQLFVGVRRAVRSNADCGWRWDCPAGLPKEEENVGGGLREGFSRKGGGFRRRVLASCGDFVVRAEVVEESLNVFWTAGMRVKMAMETEDSSRMTWFQGTAASAFVPENGPWRGSPWQMLQP